MKRNPQPAHWFNLLVLFCLLGAACTPQPITHEPVTPTSTFPAVATTSPAASTLLPATGTPEPTATSAPVVSVGGFQSDGMLKQGWYWLNDASIVTTAEWTLNNLPAQPASIDLEMKALATDAYNTGGLWASFILSYFMAGSGSQKQLLGQQTVILPNTSSKSDPQGYTCTGTVTLDSSLLPAGVSSISIIASRSAETASDLPVGDLVAFAPESIEIGPAPLPFEPVNAAVYQGGDFSSDGDFVNGWWWLRDADHLASATWNFSEIPPGTADIVINFEVLATDRLNGGGGFNASFYVSYGPVPEERQTADIPSELVTLTNAGLEVDPNGYTSRGTFTIHRKDLPPGTDRIWMRMSRLDSQGQNPIDLHIAFMQSSVTFSEGSTDTGDSDSQDDAILITSGSYTGSLDAQDTDDWYKFYLRSTQVVTLQSQVPAYAQFKATLYDPDMNQKEESVPVSTQALPNGFYLAHIAGLGSGGYWYLKFERVSGAGNYYFTISIDDQQDGRVAGDAADTSIRSIDNGTYPGIVMQDDLKDLYRVSLLPGEVATIELTPAWPAGDAWSGSTILRAELLFSGGSVWKAADTSQGKATLTATNNTASVYVAYLAIRLNAGRGGAYQLKISFPTPASCINTAPASSFYTSASSDNGWYWLQDPGYFLTATWLFNTLPSGEDDLRFSFNIPMAEIEEGSGPVIGFFYIMYGPMPATDTGRVNGPVSVALQNNSELGTGSTGEFILPREALQDATHGFWIRLYRTDPEGIGLRANADLGVNQTAIQLCLGDQPGTVLPPHDLQPPANVSLDPDPQIHILSSDTPIFVDPGSDPDGDGLNQNWETAAANAINPITVLDEDETWLDHRASQHVVNLVHVYPWPSMQDPQYIIFYFLETWSMDYGRDFGVYIYTSHRGDSEAILMAWKVRNNTQIEFDWLYTSAHSNEATDHSGVWNAYYKQCNMSSISNTSGETVGHEKLCAYLEYDTSTNPNTRGRLIVYAARDKHGIYVQDGLCNAVKLVDLGEGVYGGENCGWDPGYSRDISDSRYLGSGKWLFTVYNVGELDNYLINNLHTPLLQRNPDGLEQLTQIQRQHQQDDLAVAFPNEAVWDGNAGTRGDFCGGLESNGTTEIPYECSGRVGSKYEDIPAQFTLKLNSVYQIEIVTTTGTGGTAWISLYDDQGNFVAESYCNGSLTPGYDMCYAPETNPNPDGLVGSVKLTLIHQGAFTNIPWVVQAIQVTNLRRNLGSQFAVNQTIPFETEVTIPPPP